MPKKSYQHDHQNLGWTRMTLNEPAEQDRAMRLQPYTKDDKQLSEAGSRQNSLLHQGKGTYHWLYCAKPSLALKTYVSNTVPTKKFHLGIYVHVYVHTKAYTYAVSKAEKSSGNWSKAGMEERKGRML